MKRFGYLLVAVGLLTFAAVLGPAGCSGDEPGDGVDTTAGASTTAPPTTTATGPAVITVNDALSSQGPVRVVGSLIAVYPEAGAAGAGGDLGEPTMVLTTAMAESYPPQPGGPTMPVTGLDLDDLVGLSTTVGQADVAAATWTNYLVVLEGNVTDGTLEVTGMPTVVQAITPELRLRFSTVTAPLVSGNSEWFAFDLRNVADQPLELTFATSQETEVVLSQGGVEKYRWSSDTSFTQSIKTVALQPGEIYGVVVNDTLDVPPGRYDLTASLTATASVGGQEVLVPVLESTVDVI